MDHTASFNAFAKKYLDRSLCKNDSVSVKEISKAEKRLGKKLPLALREYYRVAGNAEDLNTIHNHLYSIDNLEVDGDYLVFMDENQSVVSWGIRIEDLGKENPTVWQRNNTPPVEWFSEEKSFVAFMESMLEWYCNAEIWDSA